MCCSRLPPYAAHVCLHMLLTSVTLCAYVCLHVLLALQGVMGVSAHDGSVLSRGTKRRLRTTNVRVYAGVRSLLPVRILRRHNVRRDGAQPSPHAKSCRVCAVDVRDPQRSQRPTGQTPVRLLKSGRPMAQGPTRRQVRLTMVDRLCCDSHARGAIRRTNVARGGRHWRLSQTRDSAK
jgi:hypothetical protein